MTGRNPEQQGRGRPQIAEEGRREPEVVGERETVLRTRNARHGTPAEGQWPLARRQLANHPHGFWDSGSALGSMHPGVHLMRWAKKERGERCWCRLGGRQRFSRPSTTVCRGVGGRRETLGDVLSQNGSLTFLPQNNSFRTVGLKPATRPRGSKTEGRASSTIFFSGI